MSNATKVHSAGNLRPYLGEMRLQPIHTYLQLPLCITQLSMTHSEQQQGNSPLDTTTLEDTGNEQQTEAHYVRGGGDGYDSDASEEHYEFQSPEQIAENWRAYNVTKAGLLQYACNVAMLPTEPTTPWWVKSKAQPTLEDPDEYHSACSSFGDAEDSNESEHTLDNGAAAVVLLSTTFVPLAFETFSRQEWMTRREEIRQQRLSDHRLMDVRHLFAEGTKRHERQLHKQFLHNFALSQASFGLSEMFSSTNMQVPHNPAGNASAIALVSTQSNQQQTNPPTLTNTLYHIIFPPWQDSMLRFSALTEGNGRGKVPTLHLTNGLADFIDTSRQYGVSMYDRRLFVDVEDSLMDMQHQILLEHQRALIHMHTAAAMEESIQRLQNNVSQQYFAMREIMLRKVPAQEIMPLLVVLPAYPCDAVDTAARVQASLDTTGRLAHLLRQEQPFGASFPHNRLYQREQAQFAMSHTYDLGQQPDAAFFNMVQQRHTECINAAQATVLSPMDVQLLNDLASA